MTAAELAEHRQRIESHLSQANYAWRSSVFTPERLLEAGTPLSLFPEKSEFRSACSLLSCETGGEISYGPE